jgi:prepilin signal peptidase PulO-like enzyme (type II secretory pathway)
VFALAMLAIAPHLRLPTTEQDLGPLELVPLTHWTPGPVQTWFQQPAGLLTGLAVVLIWCFALIPKWTTFRYGLGRGVRIFWASMLRPPRQTTATVPRIRPRRMLPQTKLYAGMAVVLCLFVWGMWSIGGVRWNAVFDGLLGLAMGGGIVWAVRIVAGQALGVEAMGFGDVTLLAMIGAFLGWQPALLVFVIAPFTSIVVALVQLIATRQNRLAFGPYLCLATVIVLIGWHWVWNQWAAVGVFRAGGGLLMGVILASLVLMAVMLGAWSAIKNRIGI